MNVVIRKIGNSEGVIIPKEVLDRMGLEAGDTLELSMQDGELRLQPTDADFARQIEAARIFMEKYKIAFKKLSES
ncbi:AbrB/MazE/SpoVT family DNA-binding domain-containing protein [Rhizobium sp. BR 362]|uniref:AbrB/MazE/SpoVT family DNA-binding domain-containing protein n=1 Tax=Rhizobium sp. BR 362 TaxID=3040670 RepID=UPI002F412E4E